MEIIEGNIFSTNCQTIVNTVNCHGIMGAGIALECRMRYPEMFDRYKELCNNRDLTIGQLYLYKSDNKWILNFPTKDHWKYPSKIEYLEKGLEKFLNTYESKGIKTIAFPVLGSSHGGIETDKSLTIMSKFLKDLPIKVEIYLYTTSAKDDLIDKFKSSLIQLSNNELRQLLKVTAKQAEILAGFINSNSISAMNDLHFLKGLGDKAIQKCYDYAMSDKVNSFQSKLF
jgi:O-acetyl-ADP-ribose deacetylase (regulator of RNase III)